MNRLGRRAEDLTGQVFGDLTAVAPSDAPDGTSERSQFWLCRCVCGVMHIASSRTLKHKQHPSCKRCRYRRLANSRAGRKPANFQQFLKAGHKAPHPSGEEVPNWAGDAVGYSGLHMWVRRHKGKASCCEECGNRNATRYEWANISGTYQRDLNDWRSLCVSCHRKEGYRRGEYTCVLKGTHRQTNTGRTHYRKRSADTAVELRET